MTAPVAAEPATAGDRFTPRILVFSTNNISDPGIDLAGSAHFHYSPGVNVIGLPCTSGIRSSWILHAFETGFDGVFIATDGEECAYLHDCAKRSNAVVQKAQKALKARGMDASRIRVAAICSVCAEPFTKHMTTFSDALVAMGPVVWQEPVEPQESRA
jgi:coenzyme F420-reducing hydrogenase delta subunit